MFQQAAPKTIIQKDNPDNFQQGREFEAYIHQLFNKHSFRLHKWREAKKFDSSTTFDIDHANPDLEMIFTGSRNYRFAVECKWRQQFNLGQLQWAEDHQIETYLQFQGQSRIPVFIAIGVGGVPSNPEKLFVTPLLNICESTTVEESELIPFARSTTRRFFYNTIQLRLF